MKQKVVKVNESGIVIFEGPTEIIVCSRSAKDKVIRDYFCKGSGRRIADDQDYSGNDDEFEVKESKDTVCISTSLSVESLSVE
jgi:hypothetical protein